MTLASERRQRLPRLRRRGHIETANRVQNARSGSDAAASMRRAGPNATPSIVIDWMRASMPQGQNLPTHVANHEQIVHFGGHPPCHPVFACGSRRELAFRCPLSASAGGAGPMVN